MCSSDLGRLVRTGGCLLAAKGRDPAAEIAALPSGWRAESLPLIVPGIAAERHAVRLEPVPPNESNTGSAGSALADGED